MLHYYHHYGTPPEPFSEIESSFALRKSSYAITNGAELQHCSLNSITAILDILPIGGGRQLALTSLMKTAHYKLLRMNPAPYGLRWKVFISLRPRRTQAQSCAAFVPLQRQCLADGRPLSTHSH